MEEQGEHDYSLKRKINENELKSNKKKRIMKQNVGRISRNIENMTQESLDILKNIEQNTTRIADSFEKLVNFFLNKE